MKFICLSIKKKKNRNWKNVIGIIYSTYIIYYLMAKNFPGVVIKYYIYCFKMLYIYTLLLRTIMTNKISNICNDTCYTCKVRL